MISQFIAYIDESGDEGFGKLGFSQPSGQSGWLSLGAAIVSKENDRLLATWRNEIMDLYPNKQSTDLHFRKLNHDQRVAACQYLAKKPVGISVVASNKVTLLATKNVDVFKRKGYLYNYLVRFLLERVTGVCVRAAKQHGARASLQVVFSRRGGTDYHSMKEYMLLMREGREKIAPVRSIAWEAFDPENIRVENHSKRAGLQIADIVTSATSSGLELNAFGNCEPRYATELKQRFCKLNKKVANCGVTILPRPTENPLTEQQLKFLNGLEG